LAVDVRVTGDPTSVPASVALSAYRIAQETLTNTLKHAGARLATIDIAIGEGRLDIRVADDGTDAPAEIRPGRGIAGMRERAAVHNGSVRFERDEGNRLVVVADLAWEPAK
jgi:signal transduction histidine kinase